MSIKEKLYKFKLLEIKDFFTNKGIQLQHSKKQIRKRNSYSFWKNIVDEISPSLRTFERNKVIQKIWQEMNDRRCFSIMTQSVYDLESLALCTEDYDNGYWREE